MYLSYLRLGVNIDHVATVRQAREGVYPDPVEAALQAVQGGADGITFHLREDRRHIQDRDVHLLKELLAVPMNLEMAATTEMVIVAERLRPAHCCLVPEKRGELTTEGGLDVVGQQVPLQVTCQRLAAVGIEVSLFIDADLSQIEAAKACGVPTIELHTGPYAHAKNREERREQLLRLQKAVEYAEELGLLVNAGHGLNYNNVDCVAAIPGIQELNIGHAIIARAIFSGLLTAVKDMKQMMVQSRYSYPSHSLLNNLPSVQP